MYNIVSKRNTIKLQKKYQKILRLYAAYDETYCFLGMAGYRKDCIVHFNSQGKILYQHVFDKIMDSLAMMSQRQCIYLETRNNCITVLNLENYKTTKVQFQFMNQQTDQSFIHTFPDSKMICIRQNGRYNDSRFKLTYYNYPLTTNSKPVTIFYSDQCWTYEYLVRKTNNHSQICWYKGRQDKIWEFLVFDLRDKPKGEIKKYTFPNKIGEPYGMNKIQCELKTMWEMRPYQFLLVCNTDMIKPDDAPINNNYLIDVRTGVARESKFNFGNHQQFLIDQMYMGPFSIFRTFDFEGGIPLETPVYYVRNETEQIVAQQKWACSYLYKLEFPGYDGRMMIESQYQNGDVQQVTVDRKKIMNYIQQVLENNHKQIYMHFMLEMNPQFDADLLQTVVSSINYST